MKVDTVNNEFLPINRQEMEDKGWQQPDFLYISGDAYIDHPSFGAAIITRVLESRGYKVCMLAQPDWKNIEEFRQFRKPRLGFLISIPYFFVSIHAGWTYFFNGIPFDLMHCLSNYILMSVLYDPVHAFFEKI